MVGGKKEGDLSVWIGGFLLAGGVANSRKEGEGGFRDERRFS